MHVCVKDLARERNQDAAMAPMFDQIEGAIPDKCQRPKAQLRLPLWKCGASNFTRRKTSEVGNGSESHGWLSESAVATGAIQ
jgi:hypothetical protein